MRYIKFLKSQSFKNDQPSNLEVRKYSGAKNKRHKILHKIEKTAVSMRKLWTTVTQYSQNNLNETATTVEATSVLTRYYVKSENQLLLCENLGLKKSLYLI